MSDLFSDALDRVSRVSGVRGAMIVETDAGVPVLAELSGRRERHRGRGARVLAVPADRSSSQHSGIRQRCRRMQLEADDGHVIVCNAGEVLIVVIAEQDGAARAGSSGSASRGGGAAVRQDDLPRVIEALKPPIEEFVRESRVRIALLINGAGQVLAQHGFTRSYEVMNVASLAAAAQRGRRAHSRRSRMRDAGRICIMRAKSGSSSWRRCARRSRS